MKKTTIIWMVFGLIASGALAQPGSNGYVSFGISHQSWEFEHVDDPLQQNAFPMAAFVPFSRRLSVHLSNIPASSRFGDLKLSGVSDTWIKANYLFPGEKFMVHIGAGAPTGKTGLKDSEFMLTQMLSENLFQFRLPVYGQGFSFKIGGALALPLNEKTVLGFGVNSITKQAYHPVEDNQVEFKSGGETSVFAGLDSKIGLKSKWTLDVVYTLYGKDQINGEDVYNSGAKFLIHSTLTAAVGNGLLNAALCFRQKGKNEFWTGTELEPETKNSNGNQLELDAGWQFLKWAGGSMSLLGAGRFYSKNEYDAGEASVLGGGIGIANRLSAKASVSVAVKYLSGTLKSAEDVQINGLDAMGGLTFEL